jgi:hypothetical protein
MPRIFFTGRRKIARGDVSVVFRPGRPPEFQATIDLSKHHRKLPATAKVFIEAYNRTMLQRFDFGTVADCRPRDALFLTNFDEWDRPIFRALVVGDDPDPGVLLAACDHIDVVEPEMTYAGGRSMLKLFPKPNSVMRGELWKLAAIGEDYQLWYNQDIPQLASGIKSKHPDVLGMILPAAIREILARTHLWGVTSVEPTEWNDWTRFAIILCGEEPPASDDGGTPNLDDIAEWIDRVIAAFCRNRAKFVERIAAMEEPAP